MTIDENLELYERLRTVPKEACKPISGGKLKGFTNITPQWRIEALTKAFGPCGIGWTFDKPSYRFEKTDAGEVICFCSTNLYIKYKEEWSKPIPGEGGNKFIAKNYSGLEPNDECCKMALTDALSTAAKMLGLAADVYYAEGSDSKYGESGENGPELFGRQSQAVEASQHSSAESTQPQSRTPEAPRSQRSSATGAQTPGQQAQRRCTDCAAPISERIAEFSQRKYGRHLCLNCQNNAQAPAPSAVTPIGTDSVCRADALKQVFPFGKYASRSIAEIIAIDRKTVEYFAANGRVRNDYPAFWSACNAALSN